MRLLAIAAASTITGLALTALLVLALGYIEDTSIDFDTPHVKAQLRVVI